MSVNVSPPKGSCTILNDFCLLQTFNRLELKDLCNAADVNNQFKRVSEMSFSGRYAKFRYPEDMWHHESRGSQMRRVLCKFGKLIKSLMYWDTYQVSTELMDAIPQFCAGGSLDELHLTTRTIMKYSDCARQLFSSLKTLTLNYSEFNGHAGALFSECEELKTLRLYRAPYCECFCDVAQKYPKLEALYIYNVNDRTTRTLLQLNRQIKKLEIELICDNTFAMLSKMVDLEELSIGSDEGIIHYNNIAELATLKSLRVLKLDEVEPEFMTAIIGAMENIHSLDRLKCMGYYGNWQFANQINKLKTLKSLALIVPLLPLSDSFAELGGQFPLLHELKVDFDEGENDPTRSIGYLIRFIELASTLEVLKVCTERPESFNQLFYDRLLKVVRKRQSSKAFKVKLRCYQPFSMALNMHSNLLQVEVYYG